jgi:hypothetical protein
MSDSIADIYLGEFMRLFSHHSFRESLNFRKPGEPPKPLLLGGWWKDTLATRRVHHAANILPR